MQLICDHKFIKAVIQLPGSKSISNRLLILKEALHLSLHLSNISTSKDTVDLKNALQQIEKNKEHIINTGDAGTDLRFLTAFLSIKDGEWLLTGSERMNQRPVKELVDALRQLGAEISYHETRNYPPLKIKGKKLSGGKIEINGGISSQFISALLLIAPALTGGLEISIQNKIVSWSYIQMTLDILKEFGIKTELKNGTIKVLQAELNKNEYAFAIESDWSAASYWFGLSALSEKAEIILKGLNSVSSQGDSVLPSLYKHFGVSSEFKAGDLILTKKPVATRYFEYDFSDCPDIAQTVAVTCLGLNINCHLKGLSTLKRKETDRLAALKNELEKFGAQVSITENSLEMECPQIHKQEFKNKVHKIKTYNDHRMAMSFAPLALLFNLDIEDPEVVQKSYPEFWNHLKNTGISFNGSH